MQLSYAEFLAKAQDRHSGRPFTGLYGRGWRLSGSVEGWRWEKVGAGGRIVAHGGDKVWLADTLAEWKAQCGTPAQGKQAGYDLQQAGDEWARRTTQDSTKRMDAQAAFIAGAQWARERPIEIPGEDSAVAHAQLWPILSGRVTQSEEESATPSTTVRVSIEPFGSDLSEAWMNHSQSICPEKASVTFTFRDGEQMWRAVNALGEACGWVDADEVEPTVNCLDCKPDDLRIKVHRSAESGEFVSAQEAQANPATTISQTIPRLVDCPRCGRKRTPY